MRTTRRRQRNGGIAYIEVLMAVFVVALGTTAAMNLMGASSRASRSNQYYTSAAQIARREVEAVRSTRATALANRTEAPFIGSTSGLSDLPGGKGTLTIADSILFEGAKDVTVTVLWNAYPGGPQRSYTLHTLVTPGGATS